MWVITYEVVQMQQTQVGNENVSLIVFETKTDYTFIMKCADVISRLAPLHQELKTHYGVSSLLLFGSVARDNATPRSDVDLLVEFDQPIGLLDFIGLQQQLESVLGCKVDLGTKRSLKLHLKDKVIQEAIRVA